MSVSIAVKENPHCLVCNARVGVSTRTSLQIFSKESQTCTEKPLSQVMSQVLEEQIAEDSVHSLLLCKKCFKLFDELEELEQRIDEIKDEVITNYKRSVNRSRNGDIDDELEKLEHKEDNKENQIPKKILDIPSSDDEGQNSSEKVTFQTMEDIEMQLVKIHGEKPELKVIPNLDSSTNFQAQFQAFGAEIMDSGAIDHSSDSDYEPPGGDNGDALLQAAAIAEKNLENPPHYHSASISPPTPHQQDIYD